MKVVFLCGYAFTEQRFGVSEYIYRLCKILAQHHIECHLVSMHKRTESRQVNPNIWLHTVKRKKVHYIYPWIAAYELGDYVQQIKPTIINLHGTTLPYTWIALDAAKQYPVLVTVHGDVTEESFYESFIARLRTRLISVPLAKQALSRLDNIVVLSSYMKGRLEELTQGHIYVVPGGVDVHEYNIASPLDASTFSHIVFIGKLHKMKGPSLVISALPYVIKTTGPVSVCFAGTGPEHENLTTMTKRKGIERNVRLLGYVSGKRKVDLIQQASFVVVPSLCESFGLVCLEAMACGKPVIASRVGGIPEIIHHRKTGLLFDAGNTTQLAESMVELLQNPGLCLQYGHTARCRAETYAWPEVGERMLSVYRECIGRFGK